MKTPKIAIITASLFILIGIPLTALVILNKGNVVTKIDSQSSPNTATPTPLSTVNLPQQHATSTAAVDNKDCFPFKNTKYNFEITCPTGWKLVRETSTPLDGSLAPMLFNAAFGTGNYGNEGYDGQFFVFVYDKSLLNQNDIPGLSGKQFADRVTKKENIKLNGHSAEKTTITSPSTPGWVLKRIMIEKGNQIYLIHNGAVDDSLFEDFSKSFKLN